MVLGSQMEKASSKRNIFHQEKERAMHLENGTVNVNGSSPCRVPAGD